MINIMLRWMEDGSPVLRDQKLPENATDFNVFDSDELTEILEALEKNAEYMDNHAGRIRKELQRRRVNTMPKTLEVMNDGGVL